MSEIKTRQVCSVGVFTDTVHSILEQWTECGKEKRTVWYRGVDNLGAKRVNHEQSREGQSFYSLFPQLYRNDAYDEYEHIAIFKSLAPSYLFMQTPPSSNWDWYVLMQHYGVRTRLLDWTENAFAALYFALRNIDRAINKKRDLDLQKHRDEPPRVWILDAQHLTFTTLGYEKRIDVVDGGFAVFEDKCRRQAKRNVAVEWVYPQLGKKPILRNFYPRANEPYLDETRKQMLINFGPIAIYPKRFEPRIVAQQGTFTVHGLGKIPIESYLCAPEDEIRAAVHVSFNLWGDCKKCKHKEEVEEYTQGLLARRKRKEAIAAIDIVEPIKVLAELKALGIHEFALFPDMTYLGKHVNDLAGKCVAPASKKKD